MFIQHSQKTIYEKLVDYLLVTLLFLAFSAVTLFIGTGAALSATFITVYKMQTDIVEESIFYTFKKQLKLTLLPSIFTFVGIALIFGGGVFLILEYIPTEYTMRLPLLIIGLVYGALFLQYAFPIVSVFKHKGPFHLIKNTLLLMHLHPIASLLLLFNALTFYAIVFVIHPVLIYLALMFVFYMQGRIFKPLLKLYVERIAEKEDKEPIIE